jgi:hypothetical protein
MEAHHHHTKRVVQDGGRELQIVHDQVASGHELCDCPRCGSGLIQPVQVRRCDDCCWHVQRRCPECEWAGVGLFTAEALTRFQQQLDVARASLGNLLQQIERSHMERDVERFARAVSLDHILPEDF